MAVASSTMIVLRISPPNAATATVWRANRCHDRDGRILPVACGSM
jgi:hypothetical protein